MSAFDIPAVSCLAGDPSFYGANGRHFKAPAPKPLPYRLKPATSDMGVDIEALKAYRGQNKSHAACARRFNISRDTVTKLLAEPKGTRVKKFTFDKALARQMYLAGKSPRVIGAHFGIGRQPIAEYIASLNLDPQAVAKARRLRRPRADKQREARMTALQAATYDRLGGAKWLRGLLDSMGAA